MERYRVMEWLNFVATEVHKQFAPLWYPTTPDATKEAQRAKLADALRPHCEDAGEAAVSHRRDVHRGRRLPLHGRQLGGSAQDRSRSVARAASVPAPASPRVPKVREDDEAEGLIKDPAPSTTAA
jgi:glutathione S-transferase